MPSPVKFDFQDLADAVVRNNVGVDRITLAVRAQRDGNDIVIAPTGQRLPADGAPPAAPTATAPWLWCDVLGYDEGETVRLRCTGTSAGPDARPAPAPRH